MRDMADITDCDLIFQVNNLTQVVQVTQSCETMQWYKMIQVYNRVEPDRMIAFGAQPIAKSYATTWSQKGARYSSRATKRFWGRSRPKTEDSQWKVIIFAGEYY